MPFKNMENKSAKYFCKVCSFSTIYKRNYNRHKKEVHNNVKRDSTQKYFPKNDTLKFGTLINPPIKITYRILMDSSSLSVRITLLLLFPRTALSKSLSATTNWMDFCSLVA